MKPEPNFERVAVAMADISRKRMLCALMDGRAHTGKELALCAGVSASTTTGHLAMLRRAGLIESEKSGRSTYHRLTGAEVAGLLEGMSALVPPSFAASLRRVRRTDPDSLQARCCYDHIAGSVGVEICDGLIAAKAIDVAEGVVRAGVASARLLDYAGVNAQAGDNLGKTCLDWSERRVHLSGRLGRVLLLHWLGKDWLRHNAHGRGLTVTTAGRAALATLQNASPDAEALSMSS